MNTKFWIENPSILINLNNITELWPTSDMNKNQKLNALSRLIIILTLLGFIISKSYKILITGIITLVIIILLKYINYNNKNNNLIEPFSELKDLNKNFTMPTENNPMMNVALTEYLDNPERKEAAPAFEEAVEEKINEKTKNFIVSQFNDKTDIENKLFSDLGDNLEFNQSMRNFYTTANTNIPNDQKSFAEYCYGDMISCKDNNPVACLKNNPRYTTPYP